LNSLKTALLVLLSATTLACRGGERSGPLATGDGAVKVLATVNGVPITEGDVNQRSRRGMMGELPGHEPSPDVVATLVREELAHQKAVQLGLDRDPAYRAKLDDLQAQVRAYQRKEMAALLRAHAQQQAAVGDDEARGYFERNAPLLQARFHVQQILYKGDLAEITRDHEALKGGAPFDEVASRRFQGLPAGAGRPWDLGELSWFQFPPAWRDVVDRLEPGRFSDVIADGERHWIVRVAGKRVDPAITFAAEKERIVELLRREKAATLHDRLLSEMAASSSVVLSK
jgi:peptidyl-prolyl cis-trans isomerase C